MTVTLYNKVHEIILDVEQPLIAGQLAAIDGQLERAISELNWTSEGGALGGQQPLPTNTEICHTHTLQLFACAIISEPYLLVKKAYIQSESLTSQGML